MNRFFTRKMTLSLALALSLTLVAASLALAAVWTDKADYSPGETVTIYGDNSDGAAFLPGESVLVSVIGPNDYTASCEAVADENGAWSCQVTLWSDERAVGEYAYTAIGQTSGVSQSGTFTDAINISATDGSTCSSNIESVISGTPICAKATGLGNNASGKIEWWAPGASTATRTTYFSNVNGNTTDTFTPTDCGTWTLNVYKPISTFQGSDTFEVTGCDTTPPLITYTISGTLGNDGWYTSDVTLSWTVTDPESSFTTEDCDEVTITSDTPGTTFTCTATSAGGTSTASVTIKRDATAPTITLDSRSPAPNSYGWNNSDVTVTWTCSDALSGAVADTVSQTVSSEGKNQSVTGTCTDNAGNSASDTQTGINIDKTSPTLNPSVSPDPVILNGSATASPNASDSLSGIDTASCDPVDTSSVGKEKSVNCYASDKAGNSATASAKYWVIYAPAGTLCLGAPGHQVLQPINTDGSSIFKQKSTVPVKFRVCDANGVSIGTPGVVASFKLITIAEGSGEEITEDPVSTTPDTAFRWSATDQQWIFNLSTKNLNANKTYTYRITLNDGTEIEFSFGLK